MSRLNRQSSLERQPYYRRFEKLESLVDSGVHTYTNTTPIVLESFYRVVSEYITSKGFPLSNDNYDAFYGKLMLPWYRLHWNVSNELVTKDGRIAKRVSKFLYTEYGIRLAPEDVSMIGNFANTYSVREREFDYDITDRFDWEDGMYGHEGSCWFGGDYYRSRDILDTTGGFALRLYRTPTESNRYSGVGRVWVMPFGGHDKDLFIFNAYGIDLTDAANLLVSILGSNYAWRKVDVRKTTSDIYINDDSGVLVFRTDDTERDPDYVYTDSYIAFTNYLDTYDGRYAEDSNDYCICESCGDRIYVENSYSSDHGDGPYCQGCYNDRYAYCHECESEVSADDMYEFNGKDMCQHCLDKIAGKCWNCDTYHEFDDLTEDETGEYFCSDCDHLLTECNHCGTHYYRGLDWMTLGYDGEYYCTDCKDYAPDESENDNGDGINYPRPIVTDNQFELPF